MPDAGNAFFSPSYAKISRRVNKPKILHKTADFRLPVVCHCGRLIPSFMQTGVRVKLQPGEKGTFFIHHQLQQSLVNGVYTRSRWTEQRGSCRSCFLNLPFSCRAVHASGEGKVTTKIQSSNTYLSRFSRLYSSVSCICQAGVLLYEDQVF